MTRPELACGNCYAIWLATKPRTPGAWDRECADSYALLVH